MSSFDFGAAIRSAPANTFNNDLAPAGENVMVCKVAKARDMSSTGKYGIRLKWEVVAGETGAGSSAWSNLWYHPEDSGSMTNLVRQLESVGVTRDDLAAKAEMAGANTPELFSEVVASCLLGKTASIKVKHETYKGSAKAEAGWINPVPKNWQPNGGEKGGGLNLGALASPGVPAPPVAAAPVASAPPPPPPGMPI